MSKTVITFLVGAVAGAIIELIVMVIFEDFAKRWYKRIQRKWWWLRSRLRSKDHLLSHELFQIGKWRTNWIVLEGTASQPYRKEHIICQLDPNPLRLPQELQGLKQEIEDREAEIEVRRGTRTYFNGPMVSFIDFSYSRTASLEEPLLVLRFKPTDYYTFLSTSMSLDRLMPNGIGSTISVRDKYLRDTNYRRPVPEIATSFAVNLSVVTKDGYLVIAKRGQRGIGGYPGNLTAPVNECVNPHVDRSEDSFLNVFRTARRGTSEELGLDVADEEIQFFSLGVDTVWYFYALTGMITSSQFTRDDIIARRTVGVKDKWEATELFFLELDPQKVAYSLRDMGGISQWHPAGFVSVIQTLIHECGQRSVEQAFKRILSDW